MPRVFSPAMNLPTRPSQIHQLGPLVSNSSEDLEQHAKLSLPNEPAKVTTAMRHFKHGDLIPVPTVKQFPQRSPLSSAILKHLSFKNFMQCPCCHVAINSNNMPMTKISDFSKPQSEVPKD